MSKNTKILGDRGEELAAQYLLNKGYEILKRNFRCRKGEIDLIAYKDDILIFVEVKSSLFNGKSNPELRVNRVKQIRMSKTALAYLSQNPPQFESCRFDIITITSRNGRELIDHIINAFWSPEGWENS